MEANQIAALRDRIVYEVRCLRTFLDGRRDVPVGALADALRALDDAEMRLLPSARLRAEGIADEHDLAPQTQRQNAVLAIEHAVVADRADIPAKAKLRARSLTSVSVSGSQMAFNPVEAITLDDLAALLEGR